VSNLRDLKRSGGFLHQTTEGWQHWHEGEEPHCPYPDCGRAFAGPIAEGRVVSTRIPAPERDVDFLMPMRCRNCKKEFEIATPGPKGNRTERTTLTG